MSKTFKLLPKIVDPILIIQGDNDPTVKRESAKLIYDSVSAKDKQLMILPRDKHSILADEKHDEVFEAVYHFIERHVNDET
jgi:esterase/lipase